MRGQQLSNVSVCQTTIQERLLGFRMDSEDAIKASKAVVVRFSCL